MPLNTSGSKASVGQNIKTEMAAGKKQKQAVAIALNVARKAKGKGTSAPAPSDPNTAEDTSFAAL